MGGIFGKNKRLRVFPKRVVLYKAKGETTSGAVRMFCDASTWTGENHVCSARVGRTPKGPELSAAKLDAPGSESAAQAERGRGERAASLRAQITEAPLAAAAGDVRDVEVSEEHREPAERRNAGREGRQSEAAPRPPASWAPNEQLGSEGRQVPPLTQATVEADVHASAGGQGGPGEGRSATAGSELPAGAEQEDGVVSAAREMRAGDARREAAAGAPAAFCAVEPPSKAAETGEDAASAPRSAQEQASCAAAAPPDPPLRPDTEPPVTGDTEENPFEGRAEVCDDGQASKEPK